MSRIAILGGGSWGTALAILLSRARESHQIAIWVHDPALAGAMPVDDAPPAHRCTAQAVAALTAPARGHELAAQREAVARLSRELARLAEHDHARRVQLRKARRVMQYPLAAPYGQVVDIVSADGVAGVEVRTGPARPEIFEIANEPGARGSELHEVIGNLRNVVDGV